MKCFRPADPTRGVSPTGGADTVDGHAGWTHLVADGAKSYATVVTCGVTMRFSGGGGEMVFHSSPDAPHGLGPLTEPHFSDHIR